MIEGSGQAKPADPKYLCNRPGTKTASAGCSGWEPPWWAGPSHREESEKHCWGKSGCKTKHCWGLVGRAGCRHRKVVQNRHSVQADTRDYAGRLHPSSKSGPDMIISCDDLRLVGSTRHRKVVQNPHPIYYLKYCQIHKEI